MPQPVPMVSCSHTRQETPMTFSEKCKKAGESLDMWHGWKRVDSGKEEVIE